MDSKSNLHRMSNATNAFEYSSRSKKIAFSFMSTFCYALQKSLALNLVPPAAFRQAVSSSVKTSDLVANSTIIPIQTYLNHHTSNHFPRHTHPNSHITQQRRMTNKRSIAVSLNIACKFKLCRIGMSCANISVLKSFELLLRA